MDKGISLNGRCHPLHRLRRVRISEGISLRALARRMNRRVSEIKRQEDQFTDLQLSDLYRWQEELNVPLRELLSEPEENLSGAVHDRATLLRVAKTVKSLLKNSTDGSTKRMVQSLLDQLMLVMPELEHVTPWHECGTRRSLDEPSRTDERLISASHFARDKRESE